MRLSMDPTPPVAALTLLMVSLVAVNFTAMAALLSLAAVAVGGARLMDDYPY